jgi:predicted AAA+ superfamily ATPase
MISFDFDVLSLHKIISFIGARRVGKTYFMYQIIREMIKRGLITIEQVVFIDFSEFFESKIDFSQILLDFYTLYPDKKPYFFFDEIQEIDDFRAGILMLFNRDFQVCISVEEVTKSRFSLFLMKNFDLFEVITARGSMKHCSIRASLKTSFKSISNGEDIQK